MDRPYKGTPHYVREWMSPEEWVSAEHLQNEDCISVLDNMESVVIHMSGSRKAGDLSHRKALWCLEAACVTPMRYRNGQ
jgi:hypothetical protein